MALEQQAEPHTEALSLLTPTSIPWREAALAGIAATIASFLLYGYHGARWVDAPIIRSFMDPALYAGDPFVAPFHALTPASIPYRLLAAGAGLISADRLEIGLLLFYLPATFASLTLLYAIAMALFGNRATALIVLALYLGGTRLLSIGSPAIHSAEMTPQVLALPLELGAILALLRARWTLSGALFGLAFNLHAPVGAQLGLLFGGWLLLLLLAALSAGVWRPLAMLSFPMLWRAAGVALLAASPTLVGALLGHLRPLEPWEIELALATTGSDLSVARSFDSRALALSNLLGIAFLVLLAMRVKPSQGGGLVTYLIGGSALLLLFGALAVDLLSIPALTTVALRLNIARASWLPNLLGLLLLADYVRLAWQANRPPRPLVLALIGAALATPNDVLPLEPLWQIALALTLGYELAMARWPAVEARLRWLAIGLIVLAGVVLLALGLRGTAMGNTLNASLSLAALGYAVLIGAAIVVASRLPLAAHRRQWGLIGLLAVAFLAVAVTRNLNGWLNPISAGEQPAEDVIAWARTTPTDSQFLIHPNDPFALEFLRRADRRVFVVREGANHGLYFPENNREFARRLNALGISDPLDFQDQFDEAYDDLSEDDVRAIAREFEVRYFIRPPGSRFNFPSAFRADKYTVYQVEP